MKLFRIDEVLIYNPTIKSKKKKPIQSDIQQAKILSYYPSDSMIQQKFNTVGMAQGVYEFCNSLLPEQLRQRTIQTIFMDTCCLVQQQVEESIWIFIKIGFDAQNKYKQESKNRDQNDQFQIQTGFINSSFNEEILGNFIHHFYYSFKVFYGKIEDFLFLQKLPELEKILNYFVPKYVEINSYGLTGKFLKNTLDISSYLFKNIRAIPLDINSSLKFGYFKNVYENYEPNIMDMIIFVNGYLVYTTLDKNITQFFCKYLFGTIEPFKFENQKIKKVFKILPEISSIKNIDKYGTIFNSAAIGFESKSNINSKIKSTVISDPKDISRASISISAIPSKVQQLKQEQEDLLGMKESSKFQLIDVYFTKNGQQIKYKLNYFIEQNMVFLTFYKKNSSLRQLIFANRFFHDNLPKFSVKINEIFQNLFVNSTSSYKFLFMNESTYIGKSTFTNWSLIGNQIKYTLNKINQSKQSQIITAYQNYWVYGIKRMNRILIILISNETPLHKLQDFVSKMTKDYFSKCFM